MGRIRFYFAASLDGFIADPNGGVAFLDEVEEEDGDESEDPNEFFGAIGTIVMGRGTYKFIEDYGSWPYGPTPTIVLTHRPIEQPLCELETRVVEDVPAFARELRALEKDVWICGGGKVMGAFLSAGEVDAIEMTIVPVAIGTGIPMYAGITPVMHRFELEALSRSSGGSVHLKYKR